MHPDNAWRGREAGHVPAELERFLASASSTRSTGALDIEAGLAAVLAGAHAWQRAAPSRRLIEQRLTAELETFFGAEAADRLVRKARESGTGLLAHARPFLVTYLGRRNAAQLLDRVGASLEPRRDGSWT